MTNKELSQLYWLNREIESDLHRLEELKRLAEAPTGTHLTGMPSGGAGEDSALERITLEIVDLEAIIKANQIRCIHERNRLERYIDSIEDSQTRQIFQLRYVNGLSWAQVAYSIGNNTEDSVKKRVYRYLKDTDKNEHL